ncbi:MAG: phage portal protein [Rhizomicrobium sp.]
MAIFRTVAAAMQRSGGTPSYGMIPPLGSVSSAAGVLISQSTAMTISTVYCCVDRLATDLARCTPYLYRLKDDGSEDIVTDHPLMSLFNRPNDVQTWFEFACSLWVGFLLRGNAYAAILRDRRGYPIGLIPINPDAVMVLEATDGSIFYNVNRIGLWQIAMLRDFPNAIPAEDMLHLRGLSFNALVGVSTIGLARDALGLEVGQQQQAARWIGNGARPSTWLKTNKTMTPEAADRLRTQFDSLHAGVQNAGRTVVLEDGLEPVPLQLTSVDLEFISQRNFSVLEICRFFGVPPHKVFATDGKTSVQNIAAQDQDYVNTAVMQKTILAEQRMRRTFDLDREGIFVGLDERQLLRADVMTRSNVSRLNILSGKTTQNEERRADRLPPLPGGDKLLTPSNMAAEGSDITGQAADGAGRPKDGTLSAAGAGTGITQQDIDAAPQN